MAVPQTSAELVDNPTIGTIRTGIERGMSFYSAHTIKYQWNPCPDCGKLKWVRLIGTNKDMLQHPKCHRCSHKVPRPQYSGAKHHAYKGGTHKSASGYLVRSVYGYREPNKQCQVYEHVLIWERVHNKKLPIGYVIHHLNGIKDDNRPENLLAMKKGEHIHQGEPYKKRIRELEAKIYVLEKVLESKQLIWLGGEN